LLELIAQFPRVNPKPTASDDEDGLDVSALLSRIRARYKALCASLGVKPRLHPAPGPSPESNTVVTDEIDNYTAGQVPSDDLVQNRTSAVWSVQSVSHPPGADMSF